MTRDTCIWKCFPRGIFRLSFLTVSSSGHCPQSSKGPKLLLAGRVPMCLTSLLLECAAVCVCGARTASESGTLEEVAQEPMHKWV